MFYLLAVGSMFAYALQHALLVRYARKIDGLSLAFYRAVSFSVTLLPLLIGASVSDILAVLKHWPLLLSSGFAGGIYLVLAFTSYRFLSISFSGSITMAVTTIATALLGWIALHETLSPLGLGLIAIIVAGVVSLGIQYERMDHLEHRMIFGIALAVVSGIPAAFTKFLYAVLTRETDSLVGGYFWELSIGAACIVLIGLRWMWIRSPLQRIDGRTFLTLAGCASPTLIGTGLFGLAVHSGPITVVGAVGSGHWW